MATGSGRNVELNVGVTTSGTDSLKSLRTDVDNLAKEGGDAAPEFLKLGAAIDTATTKTQELRKAETDATASVSAEKAAIATKRDELARLKITSDAATRSTTEYRDAERTLKLAIVDGGTALRDKRDALAQASTATKNAAAAESSLRAELAAAVASYRAAGNAAATAGTQQAQSADRVRDSLAGVGQSLRSIQQAAAAVVGGQLLGGLIGDLAKTADGFQNLQARIRLVTGEGAAFDTAWNGVLDVANRTNTSLEATGELFTRIAAVGKTIGVSNTDALRLVESINQSLTISGASAEASSAAVTQLIQGLQSGVLRGDEFNSVMEQAPRLAKALADGLGVTTGELRKLAEAGQLTSVAVINSLKGQAEALQSEFDRIPVTIGRSIQSLSNAWEVYIGSASQASGASATVANAITLVSKNLDTLIALLIGAGKAAIAFKAVRIAEEFVAVSTAAKIATAEVVAFNAAQTATAVSAAPAAAGVGRFAALLGTLKLGAAVTILANVKSIGVALGEWAARALGADKNLEKLEITQRGVDAAAKANAASTAAVAQQMQIAADKAFGLTDQSRKLIGEFTDARLKGEEVATALDKVRKALDLGDMSGIRNAVTALDGLERKGLITGAQVREALASALKNEDLNIFKIKALAVFDQTEQGARRLKAALDAINDESLRRAGTSLQELTTGFSESTTRAINDIDALAKAIVDMGLKGEDSGRVLAASLDKAISAATTERAVKALIDRLQDAGKQGLITGDQMAEGLEKARQKADDLKAGVNSLDEAMRDFGLKTRGDLQITADKLTAAWQQIANSTTVSLADQRRAFDQWAAAVIAANGGVETEAVKVARAMLEIKEAAAKAGQGIKDGMDQGRASVVALGSALASASASLDKFNARNTSTPNDAKNVIGGGSGFGTLANSDGQVNVAAGSSFDYARYQRDLAAYFKTVGTSAPHTAAPNPQDYVTANPTIGAGSHSAGNGTNAGTSLYGPKTATPTAASTSTTPTTTATSTTHTVNVTINGQAQPSVNAASSTDALGMVNLLKTLESAARSSGTQVNT